MKRISFLILLVCLSRCLLAQMPLYDWDKTIGASNSDLLRSFVALDDGGVVLLIWSSSDSSGDKTENSRGQSDYWIVKLDANGNKVWDKTYGGAGAEEPFKLRQTLDKGFIAIGYTDSDSSGDKSQNHKGGVDYWALRLDSNGNKLWDKTLGGDTDDLCYSVAVSKDGGFLIAGYSISDSSGDKSADPFGGYDYWVIKIDSEGNKEWDRTLGGTNSDYANDVIATQDDGFIIVGASYSHANGNKTVNTHGNTDTWIVKLDSIGNVMWQASHGGAFTEDLGSIAYAGHNNYFVSCISSSEIGGDKTAVHIGSGDFWVMEIDSIGNKLWDHSYGGTADEDSYGDIWATQDGGFIVSGASYSDSSGTKTTHNLGEEQAWIQKADSAGNPQWDFTVQDNGHDEFGYGLQSEQGCYFFGNTTDANAGGYKSENSKGYQDAFILKFCPLALLIPVSSFVSSDSIICKNNCIHFTDQTIPTPTSWQWIFEGALPDTSSSQNPGSVCYNTEGSFDVTLTVVSTYGTDTLKLSHYITVLPLPSLPTITQTGDTLTSSSAPFYQWQLDSTDISGATNQSYVVTQTGYYTVIITDSNACTNSTTVYEAATGTIQTYSPASVTVYPNPSDGNFTLKVSNQQNDEVAFDVVNTVGQVVFSSTGIMFPPFKKEVDLKDMIPGIYFIEIKTAHEFVRKKIIIY